MPTSEDWGSGAIARACDSPAAIAVAPPDEPLTASGGEDSPWESSPQQTTAWFPRRIAQLWNLPAAIARAVLVVPFTASGGAACP